MRDYDEDYGRQVELDLQHEEDLRRLRERLCGVGLAVFIVGGESFTFDGVDGDSIRYKDGTLTFKIAQRTYKVPNTQYWTED
jgi:hypothetical protein